MQRDRRDLIDDAAVDTEQLLEAQINRGYIAPLPGRAPATAPRKEGINALLFEINEEDAEVEALREVHGGDADDE